MCLPRNQQINMPKILTSKRLWLVVLTAGINVINAVKPELSGNAVVALNAVSAVLMVFLTQISPTSSRPE